MYISADSNRKQRRPSNELPIGRNRRYGRVGEEIEDQHHRGKVSSSNTRKDKNGPAAKGTNTRRDSHQVE